MYHNYLWITHTQVLHRPLNLDCVILETSITTWTLIKRLEKKLDGNYTRMLRAILNKSWRQHPTRHQLYGHLPPIMKTIQVRRTRHAGHCWRSRDELISDLLWTLTYGRVKAGRPARIYIQQLCEDTGCSPQDMPEATNDREMWRERVRDIRASGTTWWWWWWWLILEKKSCIIRTDFLENAAVKFNRNLSFFLTFYRFALTKNKNLHNLYQMLKHKIYTVFRTSTRTCSHKNITRL